MLSSTVNDIAECVGHDSAVVVNDFKVSLTEQTLKKAAVVIFTFKQFNEVIVSNFIQYRYSSKNTVWHFMAKLIIIVPKRHSQRDTWRAIEVCVTVGFHNVVVIQESKGGDIQVSLYANLISHELTVLTQPKASDIFPNKLKDMKGFAYKVSVFQQRPRLVIINGSIRNYLTYFMSAVNNAQNSTTKYIFVKNQKDIVDQISYREMDLTFNTPIHTRNPEPPLLTYEENGFCALIPVPPKIPMIQSMFIEPFDGLTWLFLALTIACSVAVFWMFRGRGAVDSPWLLGYGMFVMFIGQGVDFSRKNRLVLTILLQLIIVMVWILCNAYEGVITSFMIQPIQENRLKTFDDLAASDHKIMTDGVFASKISESEAYKVLKPRMNTSAARLGAQFSIELTKKNYVFILTCDQAEILNIGYLPHASRKVSYFYYLMPHKFIPFLIELQAGYSNPFIDRLQYYMDLSYQAGLMHIWKIYEHNPYKLEINREGHMEPTLLGLEDLSQVFTILIISYVLSIVLFLFEIFFHDILVQFRLSHLARKLKNRVHQMSYRKRKQARHPKYQKGALYYIIHRRKRVKRLKPKKLKVRRVYVEPRFPMD
ncbi:hypothetical protein ACKWTF_015152 [Chironomus riparius]